MSNALAASETNLTPAHVAATRYVTPLREGGSLPAIIEADNDGMYVLKFRGAGQGPKSLIAELLAGELGRALGLPVPELAFVELDPILANAEPDPEIQYLIRASAGFNLGLDYLPGSLAFAAAAPSGVDAALAAEVVWFDAFVMNVDRTSRNPNLLLWHGQLWLIDHGASLYVHHAWTDPAIQAASPFAAIAQHVLLPLAGSIEVADVKLRPMVTPALIDALVQSIPVSSFSEDEGIERTRYRQFLRTRVALADRFVQEAERARA